MRIREAKRDISYFQLLSINVGRHISLVRANLLPRIVAKTYGQGLLSREETL